MIGVLFVSHSCCIYKYVHKVKTFYIYVKWPSHQPLYLFHLNILYINKTYKNSTVETAFLPAPAHYHYILPRNIIIKILELMNELMYETDLAFHAWKMIGSIIVNWKFYPPYFQFLEKEKEFFFFSLFLMILRY